MRRLARATALLVGFLLLLGLVAGCDGDGDAEPTATPPEPTAVEDEGTTEAPADDATGEDEEGEATREPAVVSPFHSFEYQITFDVTLSAPGQEDSPLITGEIEGQYVAPDSHSFKTTFGFGGLSGTARVVLLGDYAWIQQGSGDWVAKTRDDPEVQDALDMTFANPAFFRGEELAEDLASLGSERDKVDGLDTRKYYILKEDIATPIKILGEDFLENAAGIEEFEMTVWVEEESGALVKAVSEATASPEAFGEDTGLDVPEGGTVRILMSIETSRHNDPTIQIEPPI